MKFQTSEKKVDLFGSKPLIIYSFVDRQIIIREENFKCFLGKRSAAESSPPCFPNSNMSKTEQILNLPLIESFREAQEEEQMVPFSRVQNANAFGS